MLIVVSGTVPGREECDRLPPRSSPEPCGVDGAAALAGAVSVRLTVRLDDPEATAALAACIARIARARDVIALAGDLGSGKTAFARAFIRARGRAHEDVPSPTFTLVQTYDTMADAITADSAADQTLTVWHFDLYRLQAPEEAFELGIEDAFAEGISLIEWPERLGTLLPSRSLIVTLAAVPHAGEAVRTATLEGGDDWQQRLAEVGLV